MSGDSIDRSDHYESRSYSIPNTQIEDNLKAQQKKGCSVGCTLMLAPMILLILVFFLQPTQLDFRILPLFLGSFVLLFVGIVILYLYGVESGAKLKAYEILKVMGPSNLVVGNHYVMVEYNDAYIVATSFSGMINFVAFKDRASVTSSTKTKFPKFFGSWQDKVDIAGVKLYRKEDTFSVPTTRGDFVSGEAILYAQS